MLTGILVTVILSLILGITQFKGIVSAPPSITPTLFKLRFSDIFTRLELIPIIFVFFFVDMFDSIGTLTALGTKAGWTCLRKVWEKYNTFISVASNVLRDQIGYKPIKRKD